ncbi:MAG TPA: hypothetical protein VMR06_16210 [Dokdonella sp.]|uniref:DUF4760 domain-containing protein n=1 Tax=Dokdonella sp. TaxID=2291710 RepID=UPI002B70DD9E|nr:hypothetical protein [Dokdonella sp.]HUD43536.1 hypothetical protein [Dokdonella sp.]
MSEERELRENESSSEFPTVILFVFAACAVLIGFGFAYEEAKPAFSLSASLRISELLLFGAGLYSVALLRGQLRAVRGQLVAQLQQMERHEQQLEDENRLRSYQMYHQLFARIPEPGELTQRMYDIAKKHGFLKGLEGFGTPIGADVSRAIQGDTDDFLSVRAFLDEFEKFCGAVQAKLVDPEYAFSMQSGRVIRYFTVFSPIIKDLQSENDMAYAELQKTAEAWRQRRRTEDEAKRLNRGIGGPSVPALNQSRRAIR